MKEKNCGIKRSKSIKVAYSACTRKGDRPGVMSRIVMLPKIKMEGKWLEELGFHVGDKLLVEYGDGAIHITRADAEGQLAMVSENM